MTTEIETVVSDEDGARGIVRFFWYLFDAHHRRAGDLAWPRGQWWLGPGPQPCNCQHGPCAGECGYSPADYEAWEAWEQKLVTLTDPGGGQ